MYVLAAARAVTYKADSDEILDSIESLIFSSVDIEGRPCKIARMEYQQLHLGKLK